MNKNELEFENENIKFYYNYLYNKYKKMTLTKSELAKELSRSVSSINLSIVKNLDLPKYIKLETKNNGKNGKVVFPILEVAKFLSRNLIQTF